MDFPSYEDTIAAPATTPGTGAITVLRLSGPETFPILDRTVSFRHGDASGAGGYTLKSGIVRTEDGEVLDEVLVSFFRAPHSYTGEDAAEISCHASPYIAGELLRLLCAAGARMARPGEFTQRAFLNGKIDLAQAEVVADIISSSDAASLKVAMHQLRGGYSQRLKEVRAQLLRLTSLVELELDFSEEEVTFADREELRTLLEATRSDVVRLRDSFRLGNAIKNGVPVAIVGPVNAGKSTLLNALLEEDRAIVSDVPGTTRDSIEESVVLGGVRFRFMDTAGLRSTDDHVERIGIERSLRRLSQADVVLMILDVTAPVEENTAVLSSLLERVDWDAQKVLILLNKADKLSGNNIVSICNRYVSLVDNKCEIVSMAAKSGAGIPDLIKWLEKSHNGLFKTSDETLVTNLRHYEKLKEAADSLAAAGAALDAELPGDLLAEDLRSAASSLGAITGEITSDEVLGEIFAKFCIGK